MQWCIYEFMIKNLIWIIHNNFLKHDSTSLIICRNIWSMDHENVIYCRLKITYKYTHISYIFLSNTEGTCCTFNKLPCTLEPSLVSGLCLAYVQLAVVNGSSDQLMFTTLVTISSSCQHWDEVIFFPAYLWCCSLQYVCSCHSTRIKSTLNTLSLVLWVLNWSHILQAYNSRILRIWAR